MDGGVGCLGTLPKTFTNNDNENITHMSVCVCVCLCVSVCNENITIFQVLHIDVHADYRGKGLAQA